MTEIDENLKQWATEAQCKYIDAVNVYGSSRRAAAALNVHRNAVDDALRRVRMKAALAGYSPDHDMVRTVPEPFVVKGVSTYYNKQGQPAGQWVKSRLDIEEQMAMIRDGIAAFLDECQPIPVPQKPKGKLEADVIPWINIGDAHLGMLAHEAETNEHFDMKIAERELCAAISILIDELAPCERLVIHDCGDFTHYENWDAMTEASGHRLDADGRFPKMIKVYSRVMRYIVEKALEKAQTVDVIVSQGNHSRTNDIWMAELLRVAYGHTGRVNVLNNDNVFIAYRAGKTLVMVHHSDKCKPERLAAVLANDYAADWGETEYRYCWFGHIHHKVNLKELAGAEVESWNTLAPRDNWAHSGGYRSKQSITLVKLSRSYGEVGRRVLPIREIRDRILSSLPQGQTVYVPPAKRAFTV